MTWRDPSELSDRCENCWGEGVCGYSLVERDVKLYFDATPQPHWICSRCEREFEFDKELEMAE